MCEKCFLKFIKWKKMIMSLMKWLKMIMTPISLVPNHHLNITGGCCWTTPAKHYLPIVSERTQLKLRNRNVCEKINIIRVNYFILFYFILSYFTTQAVTVIAALLYHLDPGLFPSGHTLYTCDWSHCIHSL